MTDEELTELCEISYEWGPALTIPRAARAHEQFPHLSDADIEEAFRVADAMTARAYELLEPVWTASPEPGRPAANIDDNVAMLLEAENPRVAPKTVAHAIWLANYDHWHG